MALEARAANLYHRPAADGASPPVSIKLWPGIGEIVQDFNPEVPRGSRLTTRSLATRRSNLCNAALASLSIGDYTSTWPDIVTAMRALVRSG